MPSTDTTMNRIRKDVSEHIDALAQGMIEGSTAATNAMGNLSHAMQTAGGGE